MAQFSSRSNRKSTTAIRRQKEGIKPVFIALTVGALGFFLGNTIWIMCNLVEYRPPLLLNQSNSAIHPSSGGSGDYQVLQSIEGISNNSSSTPPLRQQLQHTHKIPNILIFTHHINLLDFQPQQHHEGDAEEKFNANQTKELLALQSNIRNTIDMHQESRVRFLTDEDCVESIGNAMGKDSMLIDFFLKETTGMFKADICRGAALWETGGVYLDVDVGVRFSLWDALQENTTWATIFVHPQSHHKGSFFQAFMASTPQHMVIKRYLELFQDYYLGRIPNVRGKPLGVVLLRKAFDEIFPQSDLKQFGPARLDSTYGGIEIWQEILYKPEAFPNVPAPTWGVRRACHFVVVANRKFPFVVPLYSRIGGSRMCPVRQKDVPA